MVQVFWYWHAARQSLLSPHSPLLLLAVTALQFREHEIDKRAADMYSFAVVMWEVGTGEVPYGGLPVMKVGIKASCTCVGGAGYVTRLSTVWEGQAM